MTTMTALHHVVDGPGDGEVLVLGPSLGTDLGLFDAQVAAFSGRWRTVRFDLRGHGRSPVPPGPYTMAELTQDVLDLLDGLGVARFHYLGVSIGGAIGQWLGIHHGHRLASLTVCASAARFADPPSWAARAATVRAAGTGVLVPSRTGTWFVPAFAERHPAEAERLVTMLRATPAEGYAACCEAICTFDVRADLHRITVPTLVLAGADDPATTVDMVRAVADGVAEGAFGVILDAAHLFTAERPDLVNPVVAAHLEKWSDA